MIECNGDIYDSLAYNSSFKSIPNSCLMSFNSAKYAWYCSLFSTLCFKASNVLTAVG